MKQQLRWVVLGWLATVGLGMVEPACRAQPVVYISTNAAGVRILRVINSDGSGDRAIPVALPEVAAVSFSKDGRFLVLTSQSPGRPTQSSKNAFLLDLQTTQLRQITPYEDIVSETNHVVVEARYHALTPDNAYLVVWAFATFLNGTVPSLEYYRTSDGFYMGTLLMEPMVTGNNAGGNGVDFQPTATRLVTALHAAAPVYDLLTGYSMGWAGEATALDLYSTGAWQQLTFPVGYQSGANMYFENDYAPAFSPNGQQVAYVRVLNLSYFFGTQLWWASLRIVNTDGSNDHPVCTLEQGLYVTRLAWSRDGTQLLFDAGDQLVAGGFPRPFVKLATDALWIVNTNGTGLRKWRPAMASCPVSSPPGATFCNLPGVVTGGGVPGSGTIDDCGQPIFLNVVRAAGGQFRLDISGGMTNLLYRVKASPDLKAWQSLGTVPYSGPTSAFFDTNSSMVPRQFYRVVVGSN